MSPQIYGQLKGLCLERLCSYFPRGTRVVTLTEAPEKEDYGDIDFIAAHRSLSAFNCVELANHLGAAGFIHNDARRAAFAIPLHGRRMPVPAVQYRQAHTTDPKMLAPSKALTEEEYAQIDFELVEPDVFEWRVFYASYGDLSSLLGRIVHSLGFTASDRGLWLRMQELDDSKKPPHPVNLADKDGTVLLSSEPERVMQFLGLDDKAFEVGFTTLDQLFQWLGECRIIEADAIKTKRATSHERRRETTRSVFAKFFNEWLPLHRPDMGVTSPAAHDKSGQATCESQLADDAASRAKLQIRRSELVQEAIDFFGKRMEYESKHAVVVRLVRATIVESLIRNLVVAHTGKNDRTKLNEIVRDFRHFTDVNRASIGVPEGNSGELDIPALSFGVRQTAVEDKESELWKLLGTREVANEGGAMQTEYFLQDEERVGKFVSESWEEVKGLERNRAKGLTVRDRLGCEPLAEI